LISGFIFSVTCTGQRLVNFSRSRCGCSFVLRLRHLGLAPTRAPPCMSAGGGSSALDRFFATLILIGPIYNLARPWGGQLIFIEHMEDAFRYDSVSLRNPEHGFGKLRSTRRPTLDTAICPRHGDLPSTRRSALDTAICPQHGDLPSTRRPTLDTATCPRHGDPPSTQRPSQNGDLPGANTNLTNSKVARRLCDQQEAAGGAADSLSRSASAAALPAAVRSLEAPPLR
jgi:hypothetical protein